MRSLIRPALFMVARLGLLFSLIAFAFGQTWQGAGCIYKLAGAIDRAGISIAIATATPGRWVIQEQPERDIVNKFLIGKGLASGYRHLSLGAVAIEYGPRGHALGAYHWLTITVAVLFNGVLMWVYRKRGKELADE